MNIEFLDVEDLLRLTELLGAGPVRDLGLLDSAAARARSTVFGQDVYPTLQEKAAALLHSLVSNRALVDGNKRLSLLATSTFLRLSGAPFTLSQDEAFDLVMSVAEGRLELRQIALLLH
ncbi:type II toxin-antitoxin system death-on-curing family toxin [Nocardioides daejeonensis]|uniref:type II toxin-antitoxin system death-on-curing family toxin n=1 Tax=Nocardioides daejeonensis TaxID=1046556 RepID=UPI000D7414CC|nr:type II toxin-antitoxin system death-on-curing family toxin [Nocardioides daejeonensis]